VASDGIMSITIGSKVSVDVDAQACIHTQHGKKFVCVCVHLKGKRLTVDFGWAH